MTNASEAPGGRWGRLAQTMGLVPVVRRGLLGTRIRHLVGERNGFLLSISPSHALNESSVDILVRYPQRSTIRGFRDDLLADPALGTGFGRKRLPRSRRKNLIVGDGVVLFRLTYNLFPPSAKRVERVTDGLLEALGNHMRPLERVCESCAQVRDPDVYISEGVPGYFCGRCVELREQSEVEYAAVMRAAEPDLQRGSALGALAALSFGIVAGSLAAIGRIVLPDISLYIALPIFAALGYATSAIASRGFFFSRISSSLLKVPFVLLAALVGFVVRNIVASMTLQPQPMSIGLVYEASFISAMLVPQMLGALAAAAMVGWLVEIVVTYGTFRRSLRLTSLELVERPDAVESNTPA